MESKKQSSIDWLIEEVNKLYLSNEARIFINKLGEKAKQMHEQEIIDAVEETMSEMTLYESFRTLKNGEQYYNQTFNQ
jgi:hypothetical protein